MHFAATNKGHVYRYNRKTKEITLAFKVGSSADKFIEVTFKHYGNLVLVALLTDT